MPTFCVDCARIHTPPVNGECEHKHGADQRQTRASSKERERERSREPGEPRSNKGNMATFQEELPPQDQSQREKEFIEKIAAASARKRERVLELQLEAIEAETAALSLKAGGRERSTGPSTQGEADSRGHRRPQEGGQRRSPGNSSAEEVEAWVARDSKHRSRHRRRRSSRRHHRHSSSSSSRSRSSSRERRRRRKYSLRHFCDKEPKDRTLHDIVLANLKWAVASKTMTTEDKDGVMRHVGYMIMKASADSYPNRAYQGYDRDIRRIALNKGMRAFVGGNMDVSMEHFAAEKRSHQGGSNRGTGQLAKRRTARRKGPCDAWNNQAGCARGAACEDHHNCRYCWDPTHKGPDCKDRGSAVFKPSRR